MSGRFHYFALASLFGVLCTFNSFFPFFLLALVYFWVLYYFKNFSLQQLQWTIVIFLLFLVSSLLSMEHNKTKISANKTSFQLEYIDNPSIDGNLLQILARDSKTHEKLLLRYLITSENEKKELEDKNFYGSRCLVSGSLELPKQAKNENGFNYRAYLKQKSVFWILQGEGTPLKNCQPQKMNVMTIMKLIRLKGINYLKEQFPPDTAALSAALIYGEQSLLSSELLSDYQKIGISHLLAISGLHVSLFIGMIFLLGLRLGATREAMTNLFLFLLPVYAVLTGGAPSVSRAVLMMYFVLLASKWKRAVKLMPLDALSIAFILFLFFQPMEIFDVGFQLSFIVSISIMIGSRMVLQRFHNSFIQLLFTSFTAQLASFPFLLYHFFTVNIAGIFANLIFIPIYSYLFLPGVYVLYFIQMIVGSVPAPLMLLFETLIHFFAKISQVLSNTSIGPLTPGRPNAMLLAFYGLIIIFIYIFMEKEYTRKNGIIIFFLLLVLCQIQPMINKLNPIGEVDMIDVGQGDSILIRLPFNRGNYLIDTGGVLPFQMEQWEERAKTFEPGRDIVIPFLKGKGITQIDKLILTHGDMDHIGGSLSIMNEMNIKQILLPSVKEVSDTEKSIMKAAKKKGIPVVWVSSGQQWKTEQGPFYILSPEKDFEGDRNRGSLTILARIGGLNWFFGGDLDQEGEEELVKKYPNAIIDVLKVGHHGSKTSSSPDFLNHFKPKAALISVGEKNRFGHPNQEVIDRLKKVKAVIFRTDLQGEISYRFFHGKGTLSAYIP